MFVFTRYEMRKGVKSRAKAYVEKLILLNENGGLF
jgi:hypothetical protein